MGIYVTKADGSRQLFDKDKVIRTCMRMGASRRVAIEVAEKVKDRVYEGIPTKKILQLIFRFMRKEKPGVAHLFDLRRGISLMGSIPEFEVFVRTVLEYDGFEVSPNRILRGRCGDHEVDAIAKKNGETYFVEAKHHFSYHTLTGLDESRIARAILEDVLEGFEYGQSRFKVDRAMIVTNTRYSKHAKKYGGCRNIVQIGWNYPAKRGIEDIILEKNLHPLSCIKGLKNEVRLKLVNSDVVLIRQLLTEDVATLSRKVGLPSSIIKDIMEKALHSANALGYS